MGEWGDHFVRLAGGDHFVRVAGGDHFVRLAGGDDRNEFAGSAGNMGKLANISPIEGRYSQ